MTPRDQQVEAVLEMALIYIAMADSMEVLEPIGFEIRDLKEALKITKTELEQVHTAYVRRSKKIKEAGGGRGA